MKLQVADIFEEALRLTDHAGAAATVTLAEVLRQFQDQYFDVKVHFEDHIDVDVDLGGNPTGHPVQVAVLER